MRNLLFALIGAGSLACGTVLAADNDLVEVGIGARLLFDGNTFTADNPAVNYSSDVFPIVGDQAFGLDLNVALGHRFSTRRGPYEVLLKYYYSMGSEDEGTVAVGAVTTDIVGTLDQHDFLLAFRLPGELMPIPILNYERLYYDLGMGVTTLSYDYEATNAATGVVTASSRRTRSGLAFNVGAGWRQPLSDNWALSLRADFILGKIQDVENNNGAVIHAAPDAHGLRLQLGVVRYFEALF